MFADDTSLLVNGNDLHMCALVFTAFPGVYSVMAWRTEELAESKIYVLGSNLINFF